MPLPEPMLTCYHRHPVAFIRGKFQLECSISDWHVSENDTFKTAPTSLRCQWVNTLRPRQDGRYFADDALKCIFLYENVWISRKIPLKFVPKRPINNIPALVQIMAWRRPGDKPLSEPMLVFVPTHICVTWPQWVKAGLLSKLPVALMLVSISTNWVHWICLNWNLTLLKQADEGPAEK